jgi:hypothetical protein
VAGRSLGGRNTPCRIPSIAPAEWCTTDWIWKRNGSMSGYRRVSTIFLQRNVFLAKMRPRLVEKRADRAPTSGGSWAR